MRINRVYLPLLITLILAIVYEATRPKPLDWRESYSPKHSAPYASLIPYNLLHPLFKTDSIEINSDSFYEEAPLLSEESNANYIFISKAFQLDSLDLHALLDWTAKGNTVFISSGAFPKILNDTLKIDHLYSQNITSINALGYNKDSILTTLFHPQLNDEKFLMRGKIFNTYLSWKDSVNTFPLGAYTNNEVNFITTPFGKGRFYLHSMPVAFTNYNLLREENLKYLSAVFSYLPVQKTYWDNYYKPHIYKTESTTPLRVLLNITPLSRAYFLTLIAILLFIFFKGKRKQRIIPVINPLKNETLRYLNTVSQLYYVKTTHLDIARKAAAYLTFYIQRKFLITDDSQSQKYIEKVHEKSSIPLAELNMLFSKVNSLKMKKELTDSEFLELNSLIEQFYSKCKGI